MIAARGLSLAAASAALLLACGPYHAEEEALPPSQPRYVFLFIGDGMGLPQIEAARVLRTLKHGKPLADGLAPLAFTDLPAAGVVSTGATDRVVTDSAAAGTALATGEKTAYGMLGVAQDGQTPLTTVAEDARDHGMKVGIVTSVSLDHATPAAFYAHQSSRASFHAIARQLAASSFDFFGGGGFLEPVAAEGTPLPEGEPADLYELLADRGYRVERVRWSDEGLLTEAGAPAPVGAASEGSPLILIDQNVDEQQALRFAIDRPPEWANLSDYTRAAIEHLSGPEGFFLMVESGRIDWACHSNDAATALGEVLELSDAVDSAVAFMREHPDETLIVVTADHETGGLALSTRMGTGDSFLPVLSGQWASSDRFGRELRARLEATPDLTLAELAPELERWFGVTLSPDGAAPSPDASVVLDAGELAELGEALELSRVSAASGSGRRDRDPFAERVAKAVGEHAGLLFGSGEHTASLVGAFAAGVGHQRFEGAMDNTDIGLRLRALLPSGAAPGR